MMGLRYALALLCPPLAVLLCWRPFSACVNVFLTLFGYFPGRVHALSILNQFYADQRNHQQLKAINHPAWVNQVGLMQVQDNRLTLPPIKQDEEASYQGHDVGTRGTRFRKRGE